MQNASFMTVAETTQQLKHKESHILRVDAARMALQVLTKVGVHVLKHENQCLAGVHNVVQGDNVGVLQTAQQ